MYRNEQASGDELANFNLEKLMEGLTAARENLRAYVEREGEPPEGLCLAEGFYHVAGAVALLGDPDVAASVRRILKDRYVPAAAAEIPVERMELVAERF